MFLSKEQSKRVEELSEGVKSLEERTIILETEHRLLNDEILHCAKEKEHIDGRALISDSALRFIEGAVSARRDSIKSRVECVIGEALRTVYGNNYSLKVDYSVRNNRSAVDFSVVKTTKDGEVVRGIDGVGGGVADTISLPLKLVILRATTAADKILLTDEPGKHISLELVERFADFIRLVSSKLGVQVIMCSHHEAMVDHADVVYKVSNHDGASEVERLK